MKVKANVYIGRVATSTGLGGLTVFSTEQFEALKQALNKVQNQADGNSATDEEQTEKISAMQQRLLEAAEKLEYLDMNAYSGETARLMERITGETSGVTLLSTITGEK